MSLRELAQFVFAEAARIEAVQGELVASGHCEAPDAEQMAKAVRFDQVGKMIEFVRSDRLIIDRLRELATKAAQ